MHAASRDSKMCSMDDMTVVLVIEKIATHISGDVNDEKVMSDEAGENKNGLPYRESNPGRLGENQES